MNHSPSFTIHRHLQPLYPFSPSSGTLDVLHLQDKQYKPTQFGWRESITRPGSWRAVRNRPLLVHTRDIYPGGFPEEFSLLITVRPDLGNMVSAGGRAG